jgi:hypothetical protein
MSDDSLTDEEYEEAKRNHQALREAYAKHPEATRQAMRDAVQFQPQSGQVN